MAREAITVKPMRGKLRIACDRDGTIRFVKCWNVYRDGIWDRSLFVGTDEAGECYGVQGAEVRTRSIVWQPRQIAEQLVMIVDYIAKERQS